MGTLPSWGFDKLSIWDKLRLWALHYIILKPSLSIALYQYHIGFYRVANPVYSHWLELVRSTICQYFNDNYSERITYIPHNSSYVTCIRGNHVYVPIISLDVLGPVTAVQTSFERLIFDSVVRNIRYPYRNIRFRGTKYSVPVTKYSVRLTATVRTSIRTSV
jgi:hypothetical protein